MTLNTGLTRLTEAEAKQNMREAYEENGRFRSLSERVDARNTTDNMREVFNWSSRNKVGEFWRTFYYCPGAGFNSGRSVYYGMNDWRLESDAIAAQQRWESRNPDTTENQTNC